MRETLYFKDDDSRLSFLQGNFVTLTNMSDKDIERIIKYHISPINVSVHTTNPELRVRMLNNKKAGKLMEGLKKLTSSGIYINCQIVSCPGINDGKELERTLNDLYSMYPNISNVAIVPLGVTKYRKGLEKLDTYDKKTSAEMILLMEKLQGGFIEKASTPFARLADEFYVMAEKQLPLYEHYGDFEQLEDGIGMIRFFENAVMESIYDMDSKIKRGSIAIITGTSAAPYMRTILKGVEEKLGVSINVYEVKNEFFGEKITVAGLLTAGDIIRQLKGKIEERTALIPSSMLKTGENIFLDDVTVTELQEALGVKIRICSYTGEDLINTITEEVE
jgi:putative radical SAM enzyme (TIGR03279 family)